MARQLRANITTIYVMGFCHSFMVVTPVFVPLLQGYGLSMSEVLQTQALFALTVAVCEVPSGYFADLWGRKRAIIVGSALNGCGLLLLLTADGFHDFLLCEFILGVGISLISGADLAILYDTETQLPGAGGSRSLSRLISIEAGASGLAGILASLLLLAGDMQLLLAVQATVGFLPLLLSWRLVEPSRPALAADHRGNARSVLDSLLFGKPVVLWTTLAIIAFGLLSVYSFWLYQKHWELAGVRVGYFGYIWAAFALIVSVAARYSGWAEQWLGWQKMLLLLILLSLGGLLGMALAPGWWGVLCACAIQVSRGLSLTMFYDALNRRIGAGFRATVNSLVSLGVRGIFIATGPLLGYLLDTVGMRTTLLGMVCVFAPLFLLVVSGLTARVRREHRHPAVEALPVN